MRDRRLPACRPALDGGGVGAFGTWLASTVWLPMPLLLVALALVVLGPFPDQEPALYLTAVAVGLGMGAIALFVAVFWQGPRAELPTEQAGP